MYICTHCKIGNLSLSVATVVFVLPVAINMPWNALPVCLLNSWMWIIDIAFLPLMKISGTSFSMTGLCSTVFSRGEQCHLSYVFQLNKSKNFTPGFIMVLHTFGRDLKWNPHIHCLISEGGFSDDGFWRHVKYFNYNFLRTAFRTALLNEMETIIGPSFKMWNPDVTVNINKDSTFMQNRIFVTLRTLSNTSGVILAVLSLLHPESTTMMGILLLSITIAMRIINT